MATQPIRIKRGADWTNSFEITTDTGVDFTGVTITCQLKKDPDDKNPKDVTVTVTANTGSQVNGTLSLTDAQTLLLRPCEYLTDFKFTWLDGTILYSDMQEVVVSDHITD